MHFWSAKSRNFITGFCTSFNFLFPHSPPKKRRIREERKKNLFMKAAFLFLRIHRFFFEYVFVLVCLSISKMFLSENSRLIFSLPFFHSVLCISYKILKKRNQKMCSASKKRFSEGKCYSALLILIQFKLDNK